MKKVLCLLTSLLLSLSLVTGCTPKADDNALYKAGTYTGVSENGKMGPIEVSVEFSDAEILNISVTKQNETPSIADSVFKAFPETITKNQSLKIDAISGATVTSDALIEAVSDAVIKANGDIERLKNVDFNQALSTEVINLETDIIVVGSGAAGMSAAVSAAYEGAESIIMFEKMPSVGGNAIVSGGWIPNIGIDEALKADNNKGFDDAIQSIIDGGPQNKSEEAIWDQLVSEVNAWKKGGAEKVFDSNLFLALDNARLEGEEIYPDDTYANNLQSFNDWIEEFGVKWTKEAGIVGYSWPRWTGVEGFFSGQGFFHYFDKAIKDRNYPIDIYTSTPVKSLIVNDAGEVTGVKAVAVTGETYIVNAKQAVILCTGGFSANGEMLVEHNTMWDGMTADILSTNTKGAMGDGIIMATEIGAITDAMDVEMIFPMSNIHTGSTESIVGPSASSLMVNQEGKRFVDETTDRFTMAATEFQQTNQIAYIISDNSNSKITDGKTLGGEDVETLIRNKELFRADTLEELAKLTNIDVKALTETIKQYNEMCTTYEDKEFGRETFNEGSEILKAPFYAYPCANAAHITIGGIVVNENQEVLNKDFEPIKGLYASGEVVAGNLGIDMAFPYGKALGKYIVENVEKRK